MITLQTGLPGSYKTHSVIAMVEDIRQRESRPVFYSGIKDLALDWTEIKPEEWYLCPPESIVVIDEAQRIFRPRSNGSQVPRYEAELETHRHGGIDLFLITQKPRLVSIGVRELVGRHRHNKRKFGLNFAVVYTWSETELNCKAYKEAVQSIYKPSRSVHGWYKSAEVHTVKRSIPFKVWALLGIILMAPLGFWYAFSAARGLGQKPATQLAAQSSRKAGQGQSSGAVIGSGQGRQVVSTSQYLEMQRPRVPGLAYTAPVFDGVTAPTEAPYPAACVQSQTRCQCYTQQATRLEVPADLCASIAAGGFFVSWRQQADRPASSVVGQVGRPDGVSGRAPDLPGVHTLNTAGNGMFARGSDVAGPLAVLGARGAGGIAPSGRAPSN